MLYDRIGIIEEILLDIGANLLWLDLMHSEEGGYLWNALLELYQSDDEEEQDEVDASIYLMTEAMKVKWFLNDVMKLEREQFLKFVTGIIDWNKDTRAAFLWLGVYIATQYSCDSDEYYSCVDVTTVIFDAIMDGYSFSEGFDGRW